MPSLNHNTTRILILTTALAMMLICGVAGIYVLFQAFTLPATVTSNANPQLDTLQTAVDLLNKLKNQ